MVSEATLRLVRPPALRGLLVLAFTDDIAAATAVPGLLPERPFTVESLTAALLTGWRDPGLLPPGGAWLLVEAGGETLAELRDHAARLAAAAATRVGAPDTSLLEDAAAQAILWRVREDGAGRAARLPDRYPAWPGFEDGVVPPDRLAAYLGELRALLREQGLRGVTYGHFGEGCIHLRVGFGLRPPGGGERLETFMVTAADLVAAQNPGLPGGAWPRVHGYLVAASRLARVRFSPGRTTGDGVDHLGLQAGEHAQGLRIALEPAPPRRHCVQRLLAVVPERRVPEIVGQAGGVDDVRIAAERGAEPGRPGPPPGCGSTGCGRSHRCRGRTTWVFAASRRSPEEWTTRARSRANSPRRGSFGDSATQR